VHVTFCARRLACASKRTTPERTRRTTSSGEPRCAASPARPSRTSTHTSGSTETRPTSRCAPPGAGRTTGRSARRVAAAMRIRDQRGARDPRRRHNAANAAAKPKSAFAAKVATTGPSSTSTTNRSRTASPRSRTPQPTTGPCSTSISSKHTGELVRIGRQPGLDPPPTRTSLRRRGSPASGQPPTDRQSRREDEHRPGSTAASDRSPHPLQCPRPVSTNSHTWWTDSGVQYERTLFERSVLVKIVCECRATRWSGLADLGPQQRDFWQVDDIRVAGAESRQV
jgi:hypothetical protein